MDVFRTTASTAHTRVEYGCDATALFDEYVRPRENSICFTSAFSVRMQTHCIFSAHVTNSSKYRE